MQVFLAVLATVLTACAALKVPDGSRVIETMVPLRDGVELHTVIILPKDHADGKTYPAVMDRSPYGYKDLEWITDIFLPFGFVAIGQDMRGTEKSQGNYTMWMLEDIDSRDLGDWVVQQSWSNGKIYTFGASADGIGSLQTPHTAPSWLAGQYVAWAPESMYRILFPYGAYKQETAENWLLGLSMTNPDEVYELLDLIKRHEVYDDFWAKIEPIYENIKFPNAFWGGWYDLFEMGTLRVFDGYNNKADESVRHTSVLTMDPLGHCLDFDDFFTEDVIIGRTALVFGQIFATYGISPVLRPNIKNITFYVMSSNDQAGKDAGQFWTTMENWPEPKMVDYFLHADKTASLLPSNDGAESTSYVYDPANPVPTMGGCNLPPSIGGDIACGPMDQAEVDKRSDVLTFQTSVFKEELALTGPMFATLFVGSDAIDTDFTVKISDVYPTGEARLIQDNAVRMRWREGTQIPLYLSKDKVYEVTMNVWNTSFVIAPGHALRFSISSSNWPRFSPNPNNGLLLADSEYPGVNITATNTLYHSLRYPSRVTLPVVNKHTQLPQVHVLKEMQAAYPQFTLENLKMMSQHLNKMK